MSDNILPPRKRGAPFGNRNAAGEERTARRWGMRFTAAEIAVIDATAVKNFRQQRGVPAVQSSRRVTKS